MPEGWLDPDWRADTDGPVYALDVGPAGAVYVGGNFSRIAGVEVTGLAKLGNTGLPDADWRPSLPPFIAPRAIAVDAAGNAYVATRTTLFSGGGFSLSRFNDAGIADPAWNPPVLDAPVVDLALDGSGFLYAVGYFRTIGGQAHDRIARLATSDGAVDPGWNPMANGLVRSIALRENSIYVGGAFTIAGGQPRGSLAKFARSTGAIDAAWNPATTGTINAVAVDGTGAVYAGGEFSTNDALPRFNLAHFNAADGSTDPEWTAGTDHAVDAMAVAGGSVVIGGRFANAGGKWRHRLAAFPEDVIFRDGFGEP